MIEKWGSQNLWIRIQRFMLWPNCGSWVRLECTFGTWCLEVPYLLLASSLCLLQGYLVAVKALLANHLVLMFLLFRAFISSFSHYISDHLLFAFWFKHLLLFHGDWYFLVLLEDLLNILTFACKNTSPITCRIWPKPIAQILSETSAPYWKK